MISLPNFGNDPCSSNNRFGMVSRGQIGLEGNGKPGVSSSPLSRGSLSLALE
jgi:hypothetical protein